MLAGQTGAYNGMMATQALPMDGGQGSGNDYMMSMQQSIIYN